MLHISELGDHAHRFLADADGNVPEPGDHWRHMNFDHGPNDPNEPGITDEERNRRIAYLDDQWWPEVLEQVNREKDNLSQLLGGSPIKKWREDVMQTPPNAQGFEVE